MWLQTVVIILPRVQDHFGVSDNWIGSLSSALFTGMMFGAFFWGAYSDSRGRKVPYTSTLTITTVFGLLSSLAFSFWSLCLMLFCLGFGVGGNMPTDGALYLEFLPKQYHYLLTFMSVFFSFGAVLASVLGYAILPYASCPEPTPTEPNPICDVSAQNNGWRYMLASAAFTTLLMVLVRSFWLRLPETPKFLLSQDRRKETVVVLQDIARINGQEVHIDSADIPRSTSSSSASSNPNDEEEMLLNMNQDHDGVRSRRVSAEMDLNYADDQTVPMLQTTSSDNVDRDIAGNEQHMAASTISSNMTETIYDDTMGETSKWKLLFGPKWRRTTILVWGIWTFTSSAFTMFNVFLPKYLETLGFQGEAAPTRKDVYWDYMIYSLAGVPGSILASYMIETRLGRKGTMALSSFGSSISLFLFSIISSRVTMLLSSSAVSFLATLLYAVIYGYTPEVFDTNVRGTAVGTASGLSRVAGIASPIVCGILFTVAAVLPLYVSIVGFGIVGLCVILLPYETRGMSKD
ncbi:major facilitator superfamily domain-containing protein [Phascolomyces articulosus]|uniref:Major facilitator superfamily domain-containing protein n=1 Tax=Phascolomyces articulosus TaxID=60185 RepID=A0AAD5P8J4_9FUNG|nr:major facilitator superfamily domain-containing protein [Phascolomyces articulosus]